MMYNASNFHQHIVKSQPRIRNGVDINVLNYIKSSYILLLPAFLGVSGKCRIMPVASWKVEGTELAHIYEVER